MATNDPVGTALWSIGAGGTAGASFVGIGLAVLRAVQRAADGSVTGLQFGVLTVTLAGGVVVASATAVVLARPIDDLWRRAVSGALAVFLGVLVSSITPIADVIGGPLGLGVYAVGLATAAVAAGRRARTAGEQ